MEAESCLRHRCQMVVGFAVLVCSVAPLGAAGFRTQNFIVQAPTPQLAQAVGEAAERYRKDLAVYWLDSQLPPWPAPCPIRVIAGPQLAAQGVTTYNPAPVRDFQMEVVGTPERILDSVLPHEVTHTVLATHFGCPLPRWADEGICTTVEHDAERSKHEAKLREFLSSRRGIPMNQLFLLKEYPADVLPMYAQGYSVCQFLIAQKGPKSFIDFLQDYMQHPSWTANVRKHYAYDSLAELQQYWIDWVSAGSGPVARFAKLDLSVRSQDDSIGQVAQVSATAPVAEVIPAAVPTPEPTTDQTTGRSATAPATALASIGRQHELAEPARDDSRGWYHRNRTRAAGDARSTQAAAAIRPIVPPSVRSSGRYQSAQPQAEGGLSRGTRPVERVAGGFDSARRRW